MASSLANSAGLGILVLAAVCSGEQLPLPHKTGNGKNVLYMVFDDFRPDLPFYGQKFIHAPNLWGMANKSLVFDRAYCQIAVCSPSRNSFMTGRRPNTTMVWNFFNSFREGQCPDTVVGKEKTGVVLRTWSGVDPQMTGGAGGCCTSCIGETTCTGWTYTGANNTRGGTCTLYSSVSGEVACATGGTDNNRNPIPCLSGGRGVNPKFTSLPQHFKNSGYLTMGVGKLFHDGGHGFGANSTDFPEGNGTPPKADPLSWSNNTIQYPVCNWTNDVQCPGLPKFINSYRESALQHGGAYLTPAGQGTCTGVPDSNDALVKGAYCTEDVPNTGVGNDPDGHIDGRQPMLDLPVFENAKQKLNLAAENLKKTGQNFFLAVGIKRPHLVWRVPKGYVDDYYPVDGFNPPMPQNKVLDESIDPVAWVPFFTHNPYVPLSDNATRELRRHYYSAISWADYCAGQVLSELETLGLQNDTIVVIHADHGWHLGEYNMWEKRTIWELGTRVPFMIHVPWLSQSHGQRTAAPTELLDVYPTLVDLAGLAAPTGETYALEGFSLRPLLEDPTLSTLPSRDYAASTYARCPKAGGPLWDDACIHIVERTCFKYMGYTIRTTEYRYTEFVRWNGSTLAPDWDDVHSVELYDHREDIPNTPTWEEKDDFEDVNQVKQTEASVVHMLKLKLRQAFGVGGRPQPPPHI